MTVPGSGAAAATTLAMPFSGGSPSTLVQMKMRFGRNQDQITKAKEPGQASVLPFLAS